ncbi:centromere protein R [Arapaima gigas]
MPVKRALRLEKENETPAKRLAPDRNYSPLTGTCSLGSTPVPQGTSAPDEGKGKADHHSKIQKASSDTKKFDVLMSKIETSLKVFQKARLQIEKALPTEGSSELNSFIRRGSADLQVELRKHMELGALVGTCLKVADCDQFHVQGSEKPANSYEFIKSILN